VRWFGERLLDGSSPWPSIATQILVDLVSTFMSYFVIGATGVTRMFEGLRGYNQVIPLAGQGVCNSRTPNENEGRCGSSNLNP
jgi:hypothetical protein